jgi:DNA repair exonuclease SbcCD nuclease subunit
MYNSAKRLYLKNSICFICDPHITNINPPSRVDNYRETIFNKLEWIAKYSEEHYNSTKYIFAGDVFHGNIDRAFLNEMLSFFNYWCNHNGNAGTYFISGNHDLPMGSLSYYNRSSLCTLESAGIMKRLDTLSVLSKIKDNNLDVFGTKAIIIGFDYGITEDEFLQRYDKYLCDNFDKIKILVCHKYLNDGKAVEIITEKTLKYFNFAILGHDHMEYEDVEIAGCVVKRLGNISRMTSATEDRLREDTYVLYFVLDDETGTFEFEKVKIECDGEKFNDGVLSLVSEHKRDMKTLDDILNRVDSSVVGGETDSIETILSQMEIDKDLKLKFLDIYKSLKNEEK